MATTRRSKTGCISCRIRRVKCDETKPQCRRCQSSRRVCDGYLDETNVMSRRQLAQAVHGLSVIGPVSQALSQSRSQSPSSLTPPGLQRSISAQDYVHFDLFRSSTALGTDAFIPSDFWRRDVLQLAHSEPAVWHATTALGALHQRWELDSPADKNELIRIATSHYGKAMSLAKNLDTPSKLLALNLPLIAAATMLGFWSESHMHILAGLKLLAEDAGASANASRMASILIRMEFQSMSFNDSSAPFPYAQMIALRGERQGLPRLDEQLESYSQASAAMFALIRQAILTDQVFEQGHMDNADYEATYSELMQDVELLEHKISEFEARQSETAHSSAAISIRIYHTWMRLNMKVRTYVPETSYDQCLGYFERMVVLSSAFLKRQGFTDKLQVSLEPAVIIPLFDSAKRCRHPIIRRLAWKLLNEMNRHEGMWRSDGAAAAVEVLILVEEGKDVSDVHIPLEHYAISEDREKAALAVPWGAWSTSAFNPPTTFNWIDFEPMPETHRIRDVLVLSRYDRNEVDLKLLMCSADPMNPYREAKDVTINLGVSFNGK